MDPAMLIIVSIQDERIGVAGNIRFSASTGFTVGFSLDYQVEDGEPNCAHIFAPGLSVDGSSGVRGIVRCTVNGLRAAGLHNLGFRSCGFRALNGRLEI